MYRLKSPHWFSAYFECPESYMHVLYHPESSAEHRDDVTVTQRSAADDPVYKGFPENEEV